MVYKTTSVKRVIAKVFTDLNLQEGTHRISDMIEWAGEALEKIGAFPSLTIKITGKDDLPLITLSNYQAKLPCDLHKIIQVSYSNSENGPFYPMRYATGSFEYGTLNTPATETGDGVAFSSIITLAMAMYGLTYEEALEKINTEPATKSLLSAIISSKSGGSDTTTSTIDYTYIVTNDYLKSNIEEGFLMIAYSAVPTDSDGYPLIPDDQSFMEALYWYITMKLLYPEWKQGSIRDAVYYDARRSWNYYCKQAYGNALMPNKDQMESIKNTWLRLVPEIDEHANFYSTLGEQQVIYNNNI